MIKKTKKTVAKKAAVKKVTKKAAVKTTTVNKGQVWLNMKKGSFMFIHKVNGKLKGIYRNGTFAPETTIAKLPTSDIHRLVFETK